MKRRREASAAGGRETGDRLICPLCRAARLFLVRFDRRFHLKANYALCQRCITATPSAELQSLTFRLVTLTLRLAL